MSYLNKIKQRIGNYTVKYMLGSGQFSDVFLCVHDFVNIPVAIKRLKKENIQTEKDRIRFEREIEILKKAVHQYVIHFFELIEDDQYYYLVMELANNGSLKSLFDPLHPMKEDKAREIFIEIVIAVGYLHYKLNVIHRDLKIDNFLFGCDNHIRLIDFGLSNVLAPDSKTQNLCCQTVCGSPAYTAPEILEHSNYSFQADVWSLGVMLYLLTTGFYPFEDPSLTALIQKICKSDLSFPDNESVPLSQNLKDLLSKMLEKSPEKRIKLIDILSHPWITKNVQKSPHKLPSINDFPDFHGTQKSAKRIFNSKIKFDILDENIYNSLKQHGIDANQLSQMLIKNEFNDITAAYKIIWRQKAIQKLSDEALLENSKTDKPIVRYMSCPIAKIENLNFASTQRAFFNSTTMANPNFTENQILGSESLTQIKLNINQLKNVQKPSTTIYQKNYGAKKFQLFSCKKLPPLSEK